MSEEGHPDRLNVRIEEWKPAGSEEDQAFFDRIVPQLRAVKEGHSRGHYAQISEERVQQSLDYLTNRLRALKPGDTVPFARVDDRIAGFILVRWDEREKRTQIEQFYVDQQYRSKGIGSVLLERAMQHARQTRPGESVGIFLTTGEENEGAQRLYERMGFHRSAVPAKDEGEIRLDLDFGTEQKSV